MVMLGQCLSIFPRFSSLRKSSNLVSPDPELAPNGASRIVRSTEYFMKDQRGRGMT